MSTPLTALDEYVLLGNSGLRVSPLCLGCMTFGEDWKFGADSAESRKVFDLYRSKGGNFFDTANLYTDGSSEKFLGEYINGIRSEVVVATKFTGNKGATKFFNGGPKGAANAGGNHKKSMVESVDESLKRLGVSSVDLLYVHFWEFSTPTETVMRNLDDIVRSGKAYNVAISDTPAWVISQANTIADLRGWSPFVGLQTRYNLMDRSFEWELGPMARNLGISTIPWGILAEGFLTGKHKGSVDTTSGRGQQVQEYLKKPQNLEIVAELERIGKEIGQSPAAVSINWLLQKPAVSSPLIGARNVGQLESNLKALEFTLTAEQMQALDKVSANNSTTPFPNSFMSKSTMYSDGGANIKRGDRNPYY